MEVNENLAADSHLRSSQIQRFIILHKELDADDGELTRTRKVRRRIIAEKYGTLIDALYEARAKVIISAEAEPNALYVSGDGAFEFERTASRLYEMRSADYLAAERIVDEDENAT